MAKKVLLDQDIESGRRLLRKLKNNGVPVSACFWYLDPDQERYSLWVATPIYDEVGPRAAYETIGLAMSAIKPSERVFTDAVKAVSQNNPLVAGLRQITGLTESWLYTTPLPKAYFNEGFIYFVDEALPMKRGA